MLHIPADSIGLVTPQRVTIDQPLLLSCGETLNSYELVYETYGELNQERDNAVLICHALSGNHHAAGYHSGAEGEKPGWWESCIGPGKAIDTNKFHVVIPNNIGGCHGSTGPKTINPATGRIWGPEFPQLRFRDWVNSQAQLADYLGIETWAAVVGGSLGGMQAMRWTLEYPQRVRHCLLIATALHLTPQNIAFNELARRAIVADPNFADGWFLEKGVAPVKGLALARMIGHVTYLSQHQLQERFGRELREGTFERGKNAPIQFEIESYLNHKGDRFAEEFDANTYLLITRMLDVFDLAREYDHDPVAAFSHAHARFLVVSFSTDWRFSPERSQQIVKALVGAKRDVSYVSIDTQLGHDGFLAPIPRYVDALRNYLGNIECGGGA